MCAQSHVQSGHYSPAWTEELLTLHYGRVARQFVLHFNITDFIIDLDDLLPTDGEEGERIPCGKVVIPPSLDRPQPFHQYLYHFLRTELRCEAIYTYSLAAGLVVHEDQDIPPQQREAVFARVREADSIVKASQKRASSGTDNDKTDELPDKVEDNLKLLEYMLHQGTRDTPDKNTPTVAPIAVILDYVEKFIPAHLGEGQGRKEQMQALEMIQRWALDQQLRMTGNIIILLTSNIGNIASSIYANGSGCRDIRVPLPNIHERQAYILWKIEHQQFPNLDEKYGTNAMEQAHQLANETQGMRLSDIDNLGRRISIEYGRRRLVPRLTTRAVQREKALVVEAQSAQLLEILQPRRGFDDIGGMEKLKEYLRARTEQMRKRERTMLVPSGLLLAGPPGTGKTIIAEALAKESGFNLVKMRNIQDRWVGSSERNLEMVLNLLKDLYPVVVFIDEIDQAMARRDSGQSGDSGVSARMFARILEEMSNAANRGRILWVAATNRADFLDDALLRRFDRVVPLLMPDVDEACRIFATMPTTISRQSDATLNIKYIKDLRQSGRQGPNLMEQDLASFREVAQKVVRLGLTGSGIEIIVRRAAEIAYEMRPTNQHHATFDADDLPGIESEHLHRAMNDFKPNHNKHMYELQSLLALQSCNFHSVIPKLPDIEIFEKIKDPHDREEHIDPIALAEQIRLLKIQLNEA